jgi:ribonuclease R
LRVEGLEEDIMILAGDLNTALNGDEVEVVLHPKIEGERQTGEVDKIITAAKRRFVGTVDKRNNTCFVKADDPKMYTDIFIPPKESEKLNNGDKIQVEIVSWDDPQKSPLGAIVQKIGRKGEHETEMRSILVEKGIDTDFPDLVREEAQQYESDWDKLKDEALKDPYRKDVRDLRVCTIDPVDAKDFDDALSIEELPNGKYRVGVHIADVSFFVRPGTALDKEAFHRSFSTYLVDRTIPMLPPELSTNLCSLNPNTDRLAFSGFFTFGSDWQLEESEFSKTIIHSNRRFTYEEAQETLETSQGDFSEELKILNDLAKVLRKRRLAAGAIEFEDTEVRFELDDNGKPIRVYQKVRLDSHKLVEELMLLCNKEAAKWFDRESKKRNQQLLSVFRVHDRPDAEKVAELNRFLEVLGFSPVTKKINENSEIDHKTVQSILASVHDTPIADLVSTQLLRSMAKAKYDVVDKGHFGLAFDHYLHFTSPIRRYPDLLVHRSLDTYLRGELPPASDKGYYFNAARQSSEQELVTVDAERTSIAYKQVEYMEDKVGQEFDGLITGVSEYGLFVEEINTKAQGLVRVKTMDDDFYELKPKEYALIGQRSGKRYQLGDKVRIKLTDTNLDRRQLDFELV